jgi:hypothetical protein
MAAIYSHLCNEQLFKTSIMTNTDEKKSSIHQNINSNS